MRNLLLKIQENLKVVDNVRDRDVFLSVDPGIIPEWAKFPCIGIKDGKVGRSDLGGDVTELHLPIDILVYERRLRDEHAVLSLLVTTEKVHSLLVENDLDGYVKDVSTGDESAIQVLHRNGMDALILRKIISYEYEREVE